MPPTITKDTSQISDIRGDVSIGDVVCTGVPLFAAGSTSFPPIEALCLFGGPVIEQWLRALGLQRHQYAKLASESTAIRYQEEFVRRSHLHTGDCDVVIGGWHMMWPGDDFYYPLEMRLAILTLREAEPFYEGSPLFQVGSLRSSFPAMR